ncbi:Methyl-CpG DNA binding,F-box domain,Leucine-rich repeat domain, L domain-like,DNA-binding domain [Cinara cedri]|uniref:Methyl-CpG DNA binding,F-box domain,Leucine-rich repeat domain, L domain-like,DNA-binding domain n=1 Tax=Cinara cedri TaxID=506608 RepID=A0A5E4N3N3_9HEMI|nr:Methyl-CpG DNA binding,F-box domain,Leucine-rich repeat domain, L domain-like,DNA-binding domain [Cinara cedri]
MSSTRRRRRSSRIKRSRIKRSRTKRSRTKNSNININKRNIDIKDPRYKLPFNYGWKRELVKRNTTNKSYASFDVYYYSPTNEKCRSLGKIRNHLNSTIPLTTKNFTFSKKRIGMDESKELIRNAISNHKKQKVGRKPRPRIMEADAVIEPLNTTSSTPERQSEESQSEESQAEESHASQSTVSPPKLDMENYTNVEQRIFEMNGLPAIIIGLNSNMQSFNDLSNSLKFVFQYLKTKDLITVTRVCSSWNCIAMDTCLWQNVQLKNVMVSDWKKLVEFLKVKRCISLDTDGLLMPSKVQDLELFWSNFSQAIPNATKLKVLKLYKCPIKVVYDVMCSLRQLEKLNINSIKNPHVPGDAKIVNELNINMDYVSDMINLTELRINDQTGIKLLSSPELTFSHLTKLKTLSLTSIISFPEDICMNLGTISIDLEVLEIGDCEWLPVDFPMFLKKLTNLRSLRLEKFCKRQEKFEKETFNAIRSLKKLKKLELINIDFSNCVAQKLAKCDGIKALLIIPTYNCESATINRCRLIGCLEKLSKTLTHVVLGLNQSEIREPFNKIPNLRSKKLGLKPQPKDLEIPDIDKDKSNNLDLLSLPYLQNWLDSKMVKAKTKVIKICCSETTTLYLSEQFYDL